MSAIVCDPVYVVPLIANCMVGGTLIVRSMGPLVNVAVTLLSASIVTTHGPDPLHAPPQLCRP